MNPMLDLLIPLGPFHLLALHLPIGLLLGLCAVELFFGAGHPSKSSIVSLLHGLLVATTALTIALGFAYEDSGSFGNELEAHEQWGLYFGIIVLIAAILHVILRVRPDARLPSWLYRISLVAAVATMTVTGHLGGELVHGTGFLTKNFNDRERPTAPIEAESTAPPALTAAVKSASEIESSSPLERFQQAHAIFETHCISCHGADKQKGGYQMHTRAHAFSPGDSDFAPIVAGEPEESELIYRIELPIEDDDVMPPPKKERMSAAEIETIHEWIRAGAYWPES